jgi:hypothetical protein
MTLQHDDLPPQAPRLRHARDSKRVILNSVATGEAFAE